MAEIIEFEPSRELHQQRVRMTEILRRHVRAEDKDLSDLKLIETVYYRWLASLSDALIDPAE
jgi:hypothetical protein